MKVDLDKLAKDGATQARKADLNTETGGQEFFLGLITLTCAKILDALTDEEE